MLANLMKNRALQIITVLNVLLYGAIFSLGAWPIVTRQHISSSGSSVGYIVFILLSLLVNSCAVVCGGVCYLLLRLKINESDARLRTFVALFVAPFVSIASFWFLAPFASNGVNPLVIPIFFASPFVLALLLPKTRTLKP